MPLQQLRAWFPSPAGATPAEGAAFWRIRWALCILVVGILASGRGQSSWPIIMWTIYSQKQYEFPEPTTSTLELRAIARSGHTTVFRPHELYPMPYGQHLAPRLIARAFDEQAAEQQQLEVRRYLIRLVASRLPDDEIVRIEGWRREWQVTPLSVPPVHRDSPLQELCLGGIEVASSPSSQDVLP